MLSGVLFAIYNGVVRVYANICLKTIKNYVTSGKNYRSHLILFELKFKFIQHVGFASFSLSLQRLTI